MNWDINFSLDVVDENGKLIAEVAKRDTDEEFDFNLRLIAAAPKMYEMLKEELIPTSDYGGILSFEREKKIKTLLTRIDSY